MVVLLVASDPHNHHTEITTFHEETRTNFGHHGVIARTSSSCIGILSLQMLCTLGLVSGTEAIQYRPFRGGVWFAAAAKHVDIGVHTEVSPWDTNAEILHVILSSPQEQPTKMVVMHPAILPHDRMVSCVFHPQPMPWRGMVTPLVTGSLVPCSRRRRSITTTTTHCCLRQSGWYWIGDVSWWEHQTGLAFPPTESGVDSSVVTNDQPKRHTRIQKTAW